MNSLLEFSLDLPLNCAVIGILITIAIIDARRRIIPDALVLAILALGILRAALASSDVTGSTIFPAFNKTSPSSPWLDAALGALIGGGFFWVVRVVGERVKGREVLGLGDVKLMLAAGAYLGVVKTCVAMLFGTLAGAVAAAVLLFSRKLTREDELPFGPALCVGCALALLFGDAIVAVYLNMLDVYL